MEWEGAKRQGALMLYWKAFFLSSISRYTTETKTLFFESAVRPCRNFNMMTNGDKSITSSSFETLITFLLNFQKV